MSHQPERNEKNCLNCGTTVVGRYCHVCGQENIEIKETFLSLAKHFVYDIFHFDSKFFESLKDVLFRPGFIPKQYVAGKRAQFIHPIRMYLFTSAFFFLVFFSLKNPQSLNFSTGAIVYDTLSRKDRLEAVAEKKQALAQKPGDTLLQKQVNWLLDTTKVITEADLAHMEGRPLVGLGSIGFTSLRQYDSLQHSLPVAQRDGWLKRSLLRRSLSINYRYTGREDEGFKTFLELFLHKLPYLLFLSLPFFALILKLLYMRRPFYYSDHAIFTLYHYIFSFILLMVLLLLSQLDAWMQVQLFQKLIPFLLLAWPVYLYLSLKRFYGQGWRKTAFKFLLLNLLGLIVLLLLFLVFLFFTLLQL